MQLTNTTTARLLLVSSSVGVLALCLEVGWSRKESSRRPTLCVVARSDTYTVLANTPVTLKSREGTRTLECDERGQSASTEVSLHESLTVSLPENWSKENGTLGHEYDIDLASFESDAESLTLNCFQPGLVEVVVRPNAEDYALGMHDEWVITSPASNAPYDLKLQVGVLSTPASLSAFLVYHCQNVQVTGGAAVVLRSQGELLPPGGIWVTLDCSGANLRATKNSRVGLVLVSRPGAKPETSSLDCRLRASDDRVAQLHLSGRLGDGDNVIMLLNESLSSIPKEIPGLESEKGIPLAASQQVSCHPEAPKPPRNWNPGVDPALLDSKSAETAKSISDEVSVVTLRAGAVLCGGTGQTWEGSVAAFYEGPIVLPTVVGKTLVEGWIHDVAVEDRVKVQFQGNQCKAAFYHEGSVQRVWEVARDRLIPLQDGHFSIGRGESRRTIMTLGIGVGGTSFTNCESQ